MVVSRQWLMLSLIQVNAIFILIQNVEHLGHHHRQQHWTQTITDSGIFLSGGCVEDWPNEVERAGDTLVDELALAGLARLYTLARYFWVEFLWLTTSTCTRIYPVQRIQFCSFCPAFKWLFLLIFDFKTHLLRLLWLLFSQNKMIFPVSDFWLR